jgi:quercetin dioxygenase-like cupin family protein
LNRYRNGDDFTPSHSHPRQHQIVVSLGASRTLKVGAKNYRLSHGDVILFGSSAHEVPKEPECKSERISIAVFMAPS